MSISLISAFFTDSTTQPDDQVAKIAINLATFLTILCWVFLVGFIISRFTPKLREQFYQLMSDRVNFLLWLVPFTAMTFSLFFSEFLGWAPCKLCWYQRGFIYTLALLGLVYFFKPKTILRRVGYVLGSLSALVSAYHVSIERNPDLEGLNFSDYIQRTFNSGADVAGKACDINLPCASPWFTTLGYLTTAGMALTAALTIVVLFYLSSKKGAQSTSVTIPGDSLDSQ